MNRRQFLLGAPVVGATTGSAGARSDLKIRRVDIVHHTHTDVGYTDFASRRAMRWRPRSCCWTSHCLRVPLDLIWREHIRQPAALAEALMFDPIVRRQAARG